MTNLVFIPAKHVPEMWHLVEPLIEEGVKHPGTHYTISGIRTVFEDGLWQLWVVWDGVKVLATIGVELYVDMNGDRVSSIRFVSGRHRKEWVGLIDVLEQNMMAAGVVRHEMLARKGWAKDFPDYQMTHVFLTKDLTDGRRTDQDRRINQHPREQPVRTDSPAAHQPGEPGGAARGTEPSPAPVAILRTGG